MDDNLFERILWDKNHILHALLLTGDAVWNTNLDLAVMIENWYPKSTPSLRATF